MTSKDIPIVRPDIGRMDRTGIPEVVFCEGKTPKDAAEIFDLLVQTHGFALATRATEAHRDAVLRLVRDTAWNSIAKTLRAGVAKPNKKVTYPGGYVVIATGGTSDVPVAEEAAETLMFLDIQSKRLYDVGVAGLDRLLSERETLERALAIIAVAGMDGALPGVIAGLVKSLVVGVPTEVGYGTGKGGRAALRTMLNACAPGVVAVNIGNGFGAACAVAKALRAAER